MKKLYSPTLLDNRVAKPRPVADKYETVWELTEIAPNKYKISIWEGAHKRILANPAFLDGAEKQVMGYVAVEVAEPGIAEMNSDGKLMVVKKPKINLWDHQIEKTPINPYFNNPER